MKHDKIRFGIIGAGAIAAIHADALQTLNDVELTSVYDSNPDRAATFAAKHSCSTAPTLEALLNSDVDAVTIATPSGLHAENALPAARAGKHIFCEKPLDVVPQKARDLVETCRACGVRLATALPLRFNDSIRWTRERINSGLLGIPVLCSASMRWFRAPSYYQEAPWRGTLALDGGILLNQGIHLLDLLLYLCGPVREVFAVAERRLHDIEFSDTISVTLRYASGATGSFEASTACAPGSPKRLEISGTSGTILLTDEEVSVCRITGKHPDFPAPSHTAVIQDASSPILAGSELHRRQFAEFVKAIREDAPLSASGEEGLRVLELIEAIHLSASRHFPITVYTEF